MAYNYWRGDSKPVAQRRRYTVGGTLAAGNVITLSVNGKVVQYTLTADDTEATAAAGLAGAWQATADAGILPESAEANAEYADPNDYMELVASEPGRPFTVTASSTGGGATLTASDITASAGPNHYDDSTNWTLGIPDNTQDVVINGGESLLYGGGTIAGLTIQVRDGFVNQAGLPTWNEAGYYEYRTRTITLNAANVVIRGGARMWLKAVASSTWRVEATGSADTEDVPAVDIGATGNPTLLQISGASDVGVLWEDESTARTFATVQQSGGDSKIRVGRRATVTTYDKDSGELISFGAVGTLTNSTGSALMQDGSLTTLVAYSGLVTLNIGGTITTVTADATGPDEPPVIDCEGSNRAKTFTNSTFKGGAALYDANGTVTTDAGGTHKADAMFFLNSHLGPLVNWKRP